MNFRNPKAYTLMEIMVVVVIIGLLASIALPAFKRILLKTHATTVVNNMRQFSSSFEQYSMEHGYWPADADENEMPVGMETEIKAQIWHQGVPGGHLYEWDFDQLNIIAAISIRPKDGNNSDPIFQAIDEMLDDGDIETGNFVLNGDRYMLILER